MQNIYLIFSQVKKDADRLGIPYGEISSIIDVSKRATRRYGNCRYEREEECYYISVSEFLLADDVPVQSIKDTLMHELIHTCDGCMNHGDEWKKYANAVNKAGLGYNIKRTSSRKEKGLPERELKPVLYTIECQRCGKVYERRKMSKIIKYPNKYICDCGGRFIRKLQL